MFWPVWRSQADGQDDDDNQSLTYQSIESKIYEDPQSFKIPDNYKNPTEEDNGTE